MALAHHRDPEAPTLARCERLDHVVAALHLAPTDPYQHVADLQPGA